MDVGTVTVRGVCPIWVAVALACCHACLGQQVEAERYSRVYAFSAMLEYSNDSSHIILGRADHRKIGAVGFEYQRRLLHTRLLDFSYSAEARPAILVSNPTSTITGVQTSPNSFTEVIGPTEAIGCVAGTKSIDFPEPGQPPLIETVTTVCGRQNTFAEGLSPFGFRVNFLPRHRLQFVFSNYEGYMFSARPIPILGSGALNFTFEFGAGFEWYLSHRRSVRLEYALQHFSNKDSADANPGVDSGLIKLTYSFGK
jgi:hypothetical protein